MIAQALRVMVRFRAPVTKLAFVGLAVVVTVSGCSSDAGWETMPGGPLTARGFGATACLDDGILVWSGSQPSGDLRDEIVSGGALYLDGEWQELPPSPLSPRRSAGAAESGVHVLVWGGDNGLAVSSNPDDFVYYTDGALFNRENWSWTMLPASPLPGRTDPKVVDLGGGFLIHGGSPPPGPRSASVPPAALYDLQSEAWELIAGPPEGSLVAAQNTLIAFASQGTLRYDPSTDEWVVDDPYPAGITSPEVIAANENRVIGGAGAAVWVSDEGFKALPDAPIDDIEYIGWLGGDVVVWSSQDGTAAIYFEDSGRWNRYNASAFKQQHVGPSVCADDAYLYVWGGWTDREVAYVASDSGATLGRG